MFYAYLKDLLPAKRTSTRQAKHYSDSKIINTSDGKIITEKGNRKGVFLYESQVDKKYIPRFIYSAKVAKTLAEVNLFPESLSENCERCNQKDRCLSYGLDNKAEKEEILELMNELGIEE